MGLPTFRRIRKRNDYQQVRYEGLRISGGPFTLQCSTKRKNPAIGQRLGIIASRRVGNAVKRNRGKRLIRELFRKNDSLLPSNCELVVILRSSFDRYSYSELESKYLRMCMEVSRKVKNC